MRRWSEARPLAVQVAAPIAATSAPPTHGLIVTAVVSARTLLHHVTGIRAIRIA